MKRIFIVVLAAMLMMSCAFADAGVINTDAQFPIVNEPVTLRFAASVRPEHVDYDQMWMFNYYSELTGVDIEWDLVPDANWNERKNLLLASFDLPDVFFRGGVSMSEVINYGALQGMFISINDLMEEYAPNLNAILEQFPEVKSAISVDGQIYSLPAIITEVGPRTQFLWIDTRWLEKVGMEMPTTPDELYDVCVAFTQSDYNGNGEADEFAINMRSSSTSISNFFNSMYGIYGMCTIGTNSGWCDFDENGEWRFFPASDRAKEMERYLAKLWAANCIDPDCLTQSNAELTAKGTEGKFGIIGGLNGPSFVGEEVEPWVNVPVLENQWGEKMWNATGSMLNNYGTYVITSVCENPEVALRWADYFYSEEGVEMLYWGQEGYTFEWVDGVRSYTSTIKDDAVGVGAFLPKNGSCMPVIQIPEIVNDYSNWSTVRKHEAGEAVSEYGPAAIWYPVFTIEESTELATIATDIDTYVTEMRLKFMMGEADVDADWDAYVAQLANMGMDRYMEIYHNAYLRDNG